ncbi:MAG: leucine-rich repeat protein [Clostridia bacterium]|nr:leucine-rich repeat protein [Clostridia bacterium]
MKKFRRFFAVFICVAVLLGSTPLGGFVGLDLPSLFDFKAEAASSGTCGENLTWTLESGVLTISGTGAMTNWNFQKNYDAPWYSSRSSIKSVIIEDGVTTIGDYAFNGCTSLESITLPDSVTFIGDYAFDSCSTLTSLPVGNYPISIGDYTFSNCSGLTDVIIPDNVISIGKSVFNCSYNLKNISIGSGLAEIGDGAFSFIDMLNKITVDADNPYWTVDSYGVLYSKDMTRLVQYPINDSRPSYTVPEGVTSIDSGAFLFCYDITKITLPDTLKTIGENAFAECYNLSGITFPAGIETIGYFAVSWYTTPYYSGTLEQWETVEKHPNDTSISLQIIICGGTDRPYHIPGTCGTNLNWILYADGELVISGSGAMTNWSSMSDAPWYYLNERVKSITVESGVSSIGSRAFCYCENATKVTIAETVTSIGIYAFDDCYGIKELTMPVSAKLPVNNSFGGCQSIEKLTLTAGTGVMQDFTSGSSNYSKTQYWYTPWYESRTTLNEIIIEDGVTRIGDYAFYYNTGLECITIPADITTIGDNAFSFCEKLTDVYYSSTQENWNKISIGIGNEQLTSATLHTATASGTCGDNLDWVLYDTGRLEITGTGTMTSWTAPNKSPWYDYRTEINEIIIGEGVTSVGKFAFLSCTAQKSVSIPESVTSIESSAFGNSRNITNVYYASDKSDWDKITVGGTNNALTQAVYHYGRVRLVAYGNLGEFEEWELHTDGELYLVGEGGMSNLSSAEHYPWHEYRDKITSFTIATYSGEYYMEMSNIGNHALEGCVNLKTVNFNSTVTRIGNSAFEGCASLKSIVIPDSVTEIGDRAFYGCTALDELTMPVSAKIYDSPDVFGGCTGISKITLTKGNGTMVSYNASTAAYKNTPWYISKSHIDLTIEEGITAITPYAFYGCTGITSLTIPESVTSIGNYAFCGDTSLKDVTIPVSVKSIGEHAFYGCTSLENTYYTGDISDWCKISFVNAYSTPMSYASSLYFGGEIATEVTLPAYVTSIGDYAFYGCENITAVYYEGTPIQWKNVTIGTGNDILHDVFKGGNSENPFLAAGQCGINLDWVLYASGELSIAGVGDMYNYSTSAYAPWYDYRDKIKTVTLPIGMTSIGSYAFYNCTALEKTAIPDRVLTLGDYAFSGCTGLKELSVPISAKISSSQSPYYNCKNIEKIIITKGDGTSYDYSVSSTEPYKYYGYTPWYISGCSTVIIADGVKSIGDYMFYHCTELTNITIADSVEEIGKGAFYYCIGLTEMTLPVSAKIYNSSETFQNCINIKKITFTKGNGTAQDYVASSYNSSSTYYQYTPWYNNQYATIVIDKDVTSLGYYTFYGCNNIKDVYFTGDIADWCKITFDDRYANPMHSGDNLYFNGELVTEITIPATVTKIGSYAFYSCPYLTAAYFNGTPEQWLSINVGTGNDALFNILLFNDGNRSYYTPGTCGADIGWILYTDGELQITGTGTMDVWTSVSNVPWYKYKDKITSVKISEGVTSIGGYAFYKYPGITAINLPDSITRIGSYAFYGCTELTAITLSKNLKNVDRSAFSGCANLEIARCAITYDEWAKVLVADDNEPLTNAILLGTDSDRLYFAAGKINENITWYLYEDNELCIIGEGDMANYTSAANAPWYSRRDKINSVVISDGITNVGAYTFMDTANLTSVILADSVAKVEKNAFAQCENLNTVYIFGYDTAVANGAFAGCYDANIYCHSGSSSHAYAKRNNLAYTLLDSDSAGFTVMNGMVTAYSGTATEIVIPAGVTAIGSYAFKNIDTVVSVVLPDSVTDIYTGAFADCDSLERIIIPESVTVIASTAFDNTDVVFACVENSYAHAYATEHSITCELTNPIRGVELTSHNEYVSINGSVQLSVILAPGNAQNKGVLWASTDENVATIDENGLVTAHKAGSVVITVTTLDGGYRDFCLIRVVGITASFTASTVIDAENGFIYGLDAGLDSIADYIDLTDNSCSLEYDTLGSLVGTGSVTNIVRDGEIVDSFTVIIFGDVDGNGWYDANDAFLVRMIANSMIDKSVLNEAQQRAADCNHDGEINELDFEILNSASLLIENIDQSATKAELETNSVYIEYMSLIDQSAGIETEQIPDESDEPDINAFFTFLSDIIRRILVFIFSFITV